MVYSNKKQNNKIYAWCCDIESYRGEGILAINFLKLLSDKYKNKVIVAESPDRIINFKNSKIISIKKKNKIKKINSDLFSNYLNPFIGIFKILILKKNYSCRCYVNYLPLWNFLIFLLLPQNIILGPITGSQYNNNVTSLNTFIRKYLLNFFYKLSVKILSHRKKNYLFSTSLMKKYFKRKKNFYDFNLINYDGQKKENKKKKFDMIFYYRRYSAHGHNIQKKIILNLLDKKINVAIIGDKIFHENAKNFGIQNREKVLKLLTQSKFTLNEMTNFYSIYSLDALSGNVKIFYDRKTRPIKFYFPKNQYIEINYHNIDKSIKTITSKIKNFKFKKFNYKFNIKKFIKNYDDYFNQF